MLRFLTFLMILTAIVSGQSQAGNKDVIGCYLSWQWQEHPEIFDHQSIPYDKLTVINYCFFYPLEDGKIIGMDPVADRYLLKGESEALPGDIRPADSMIKLAQRHGTKVLLSIGGWTTSDNFPQVSADPHKRAVFAHWCVKHIQNYGFDGIDIDWEFPGYVQHKGTPQDRFNFTLLLQQVRDSLQTLSAKTGKNYLLSTSLPAAASHLPDIEVQKVAGIVDFINIMTYDLFGPWGQISNHHSALFGPAKGDSARCLDGAFRLYHLDHNVPAEKINLAVVFNGHSYTGCTEIYTEHQGADKMLFPEGDGILYSQIYQKMDLFERHWDKKAHAPFLVSQSQKMLISFDDEESVALKAGYILRNNARGLVIWPLMGDYIGDGKTPLLDAIDQKLGKTSP